MTADQDLWMERVTAVNSSARRREQLRRLLWMQRAAEHLATARFLERQADHAATPVLGSLLRDGPPGGAGGASSCGRGRRRDHDRVPGAGALRGTGR